MKKLKGIVLVVILLLASIMMPFDVYADTLTTSNITYNYYLTDVVDSTSQLADKNYIYDVDFIFDKSYLGWVSVSMVTSYVFAVGDTRQATFTKAIYVNGNTAKTSIVLSSNYTGTNGSPLTSMSISVNNSNVSPMADLSSLEDIIDLLRDIDNHISIDVITELENIVANTELANQYLEDISNIRHFNIPYESLSFLIPLFDNEFELYDDFKYNYFDYPVFVVDTTKNIIDKFVSYSNSTTGITLIMGVFSDKYIETYSQFREHFSFPSSFTLRNMRNIVYIERNKFNLFAIDMIPPSGGANLILKIIKGSAFIPICYFASNSNKFSTDFALQFGLSNQLLDDLHIIAQGTNQSNSAASDLESGNSQMANDMDDLATIENEYNQQFNNQIQQIDFSSPLQNNAGIIPAANFVITIFNGLINNNPFSVLIIIVCILLIGKKVIGK